LIPGKTLGKSAFRDKRNFSREQVEGTKIERPGGERETKPLQFLTNSKENMKQSICVVQSSGKGSEIYSTKHEVGELMITQS